MCRPDLPTWYIIKIKRGPDIPFLHAQDLVENPVLMNILHLNIEDLHSI